MTRPIAPFDVVVLPAGLPQFGVSPGSRAVVIEIHEDPYEAFEIEVVDENGQTLYSGAVETAWVELDVTARDIGDTSLES
ncbi:DUF4926 domain-containing protein [Phycicoccus sp. CSK15P-2]|uniref:DUF4926 domain-containing protein n=1 Tax=Phycicoccus sp. CSK15P-2 TaxID=2807627 RepID=UPI00194F9FD2|nr:DUF4926 domain-containing protein [Phycicoccus sp. CSK15P-2]MBM6403576.1 DUF4926 domain-containing protein [Phycicoccus sp. CSK15P-2]